MAFPTSSLTNNQVHKEGNRAFVYDSTLGVWDQVRETDRTENNNLLQNEIRETSIIRWQLYKRPNNAPGNQDPLGASNNPWRVAPSIEFAVAHTDSATLVTESSGIFSFTETGYYRIQSILGTRQSTANTLWIRNYHKLSNNGTGGTYSVVATGYSSELDNAFSQITTTSLVKVDNITNDHFTLAGATATANVQWLYDSDGTVGIPEARNVSYIDFIKLRGL